MGVGAVRGGGTQAKDDGRQEDWRYKHDGV